MLDLIEKFAGLLFSVTIENHRILVDPTHAIDLDALPNGNVRFFGRTLIGDEWVPMSSVEVEPYTKDFWVRVGETLISLSRLYQIGYRQVEFRVTVASLLQKMPEGASLAEDRQTPALPPPRPKLKAGKRQKANVEGTVTSEGRTITREQLREQST